VTQKAAKEFPNPPSAAKMKELPADGERRMEMNLDRVRANVRAASTEDLLDRATVHRDGMEPEALAIIDAELRERGVTPGEIFGHAQERQQHTIEGEAGSPLRCWRCLRPAVTQGWRWHRLLRVLPVFPRWVALCEEHAKE
jgi:hypothetical protein